MAWEIRGWVDTGQPLRDGSQIVAIQGCRSAFSCSTTTEDGHSRILYLRCVHRPSWRLIRLYSHGRALKLGEGQSGLSKEPNWLNGTSFDLL
jgi:hypothetical protein